MPALGIIVEVDQAVGALVHRGHGTDVHARRLSAVVAPQNGEMPFHFGKGADFDVLDPGAEDADRNVVFGFARGRTRVTTDAASLVDDPSPTSHRASVNVVASMAGAP